MKTRKSVGHHEWKQYNVENVKNSFFGAEEEKKKKIQSWLKCEEIFWCDTRKKKSNSENRERKQVCSQTEKKSEKILEIFEIHTSGKSFREIIKKKVKIKFKILWTENKN